MCFGRCRGALSGRSKQTAAPEGSSGAAPPLSPHPPELRGPGSDSAAERRCQRGRGIADGALRWKSSSLPFPSAPPAPPAPPAPCPRTGSAVTAEPTRPAGLAAPRGRCRSGAAGGKGFPRTEHPPAGTGEPRTAVPGAPSPAWPAEVPRAPLRASPSPSASSPPAAPCPALPCPGPAARPAGGAARRMPEGAAASPEGCPCPRAEAGTAALRRGWWLWLGLTAGLAPPLAAFNSCLLPGLRTPPPAPTPARSTAQPRARAPMGPPRIPGDSRAPRPPSTGRVRSEMPQPPPGPGQLHGAPSPRGGQARQGLRAGLVSEALG